MEPTRFLSIFADVPSLSCCHEALTKEFSSIYLFIHLGFFHRRSSPRLNEGDTPALSPFLLTDPLNEVRHRDLLLSEYVKCNLCGQSVRDILS